MHFLTQSALLKALGWSLLNSLWQMGLLWLLYQLLIAVFSKVAARIRHGLALGLLAIGSMWTAATFINAWFFMDGGPEPSSWLPALLESYPQRLNVGARWFVNELLPWCTTIYLLALGGLLIRYTTHYFHCRRLTRTGLSKAPARFRLFTGVTAQTMSIRQKVTLALSDLADTPMTLGFLKPVILLPVAMISNLTPQQVEAIIVHELAHIARKDYLLHLVISMTELLFFFNPFARLLIGHLKKEREHSCDDLVLQFQYDPHSYVSALLSLARQHGQRRLALAATGGGNRLLLQRARRILQQKSSLEGPGPRSLALVLVTLLITLFTFSGPGRAAGHKAARTAGNTSQQLRPDGLRTVNTLQPEGVIVLNEVPLKAIVSITVTRPQPRRGASRNKHQNESLADAYTYSDEGNAGAGSFTTTDYLDTGLSNNFAGLVDVDTKDYSIGEGPSFSPDLPTDAAPAAKAPMAHLQMPYVPNASFFFQFTDTLPPDEKVARLQELTEREVQGRFLQLKDQLVRQSEILQRLEHTALTARQNTESSLRASRRRMNELLRRQQQLQQEYQQRLEQLSRQLRKAGVRLTTVYI
jgi:beta-lactamase regulating signal transducer with metallopeptidase domain